MLWWIVGIIVGIMIVYKILSILLFVAVALQLTIFYFSPNSVLRRCIRNPIIKRLALRVDAMYSHVIIKVRSLLLETKGYYLYFLLIYSNYPQAFSKTKIA